LGGDALPQDRDSLLDIAENSLSTALILTRRFRAGSRMRSAARGRLPARSSAASVLVAEDGGRPVGFLAVLAAKCHGKDARVIDLVGVDRGCQGRGVGKSLVNAFVARSPQGGSCCASARRRRTSVDAAVRAVRLPCCRDGHVLHAHVNEPAAQAGRPCCAAGS
jgi:GNAT superfamily N-acetyltransferase